MNTCERESSQCPQILLRSEPFVAAKAMGIAVRYTKLVHEDSGGDIWLPPWAVYDI